MRWYLFAYFREQRGRVLLTVSGLSLALASVFLAYGIAAFVDATSSRALSYVIDRGALWIVPKEGVRYDRGKDAIVSAGQMSPLVAEAVKNADGASTITRVAVGVMEMNGRMVVLYATDANRGRSLLAS